MKKYTFIPAICCLGLLLYTMSQWGHAAYILGKAWLAEGLIEQAWLSARQDEGTVHKPWPWADTWPVMKLGFQEKAESFHVLAGSSGNVLAFGPGLMPESGSPGTSAILIAGHRDTHFSLLESIIPGESIRLETIGGESLQYRVISTWIIDTDSETLRVGHDDNSLYLVTCYPFNGLEAGGPLRYIVQARLELVRSS